MLGPRIGRFKDGKVTDFCSSTVLVVLGTLLLWFGWWVGYGTGEGAGARLQVGVVTVAD